ncbi:Dicer-like protein 1 [Nowakowskiella sp. JEL0078]|nr:Dicer-like protein 1 [Nowakowskiella sp. JEL0078]
MNEIFAVRVIVENHPAVECNLSTVSGKVIEIVRFIKRCDISEISKFCGIIFVQRRLFTDKLSQIMESLKGTHIPWLKIACLTGHRTSKSGTNMSMMTQLVTVRKFRRGELNLLIATQVAEEGLDIAACNLILRFDMNKGCLNIINYIQSRGRARSKNGRFVLLCEKGCQEHIESFYELQSQEDQIRFHLKMSTQALEKNEDLEQNFDNFNLSESDFFVAPSGAKISVTSAQALLNSFCSNISRDAYFLNTVSYSVEMVSISHKSGFGTTGLCQFIATVYLPLSVPYCARHGYGKPCNSKREARRSAALDVCCKLFENGLLDPWLRPFQSSVNQRGSKKIPTLMTDAEMIERRELAEDVAGTKKSAGTIRNYNLTPLQIEKWKITEKDTILCFLNIAIVNETSKEGFVSERLLDTGLLSSFLLTDTKIKFQLFPDQNTTLEVCILPINQISFEISKQYFDIAKKFNFAILSPHIKPGNMRNDVEYAYNLISLKTEFMFSLKAMFSVNPESLIDWEFAKKFPNHNPYPKLPESADPKDIKHHYFEMCQNPLADDIDRWIIVDASQRNEYFEILEILRDGTSEDIRKSIKKNNWKYITDQPLLKVRIAKRHRNTMLNKKIEEKLDKSFYIYSQYVFPTMLSRQKYLDLQMFPSILHILFLHARASQLRSSLELPVTVQTLFSALVSGSAQMTVNYERLEHIGDAVLKLGATCHVFASGYGDEGLLTARRTKLVCNRQLWRISMKAGLPGYIVTQPFRQKNFTPLRNDHNTSRDPTVEKLTDKCVADLVESILGACYIDNGITGAALSLKIFFGDTFKADWSEYAFPLVGISQDYCSPEKLYTISKVQDIIKYKFKNPCYIVEALTHGSSCDDVSSYQRLEFLGDAVFLQLDIYFGNIPKYLQEDLATCVMHALTIGFLLALWQTWDFTFTYSTLTQPYKLKNNESIRIFCDELHIMQPNFPECMPTNYPPPLEILNVLNDSKVFNPSKYHYWMDLDPPKPVSDIMESLLGAVFLDSGFDVERVWKVMQALWQPWVDLFISPLSVKRTPERELREILNNNQCSDWSIGVEKDLDTGLFVGIFTMHGTKYSSKNSETARGAAKATALDVLLIISKFSDTPNLYDFNDISANIGTDTKMVRKWVLDRCNFNASVTVKIGIYI